MKVDLLYKKVKVSFFLLSVSWMDKNQLAFATGRRLLKLLVQRNAFLKIFCCFIFLTPCCNKQAIIDHAKIPVLGNLSHMG